MRAIRSKSASGPAATAKKPDGAKLLFHALWGLDGGLAAWAVTRKRGAGKRNPSNDANREWARF